jgi:cytochrome c oxidase cbb3-type subunit 4
MHDIVVGISKSWGLLYLIVLAIAVVAYAYWPANRSSFDRARTSILDKDDRPWN